MRLVFAAALALLLVLAPLGASLVPPAPDPTPRCPGGDAEAAAFAAARPFTDEPDAGAWRTWFVPADGAVVLPAPQMASVTTAREMAELHERQAERTAEDVAFARAWDGPATLGWEEAFLRLVQTYSKLDPKQNPPRIAREMAILEAAMFDALVVTWSAKYCYLRPAPSMVDPALAPVVDVPNAPSYPSEHAAAAGAASVVLSAFFPDPLGGFDLLARKVADARVTAGASYPSDVEAGLAIGRAVAKQVLAARADDGSADAWDGTGRITGPCNWEPTAPSFSDPLEPAWGKVRPFLMASGDQFRPPPPPACDSADYAAQVRDLHQASLSITPRQREIALYWAGGPGTDTPPGMSLRTAMQASAERDLGTMRHARLLAHVAASQADAGIAAWDAKFAYWGDRPILAIQRTIDPAWTPLLATPPFPGYVSGHSTFTGAASAVLAGFFPEDAVAYRALATEAAMSRFYAGIHIRADNEQGLVVGEAVGRLALARAATDGA